MLAERHVRRLKIHSQESLAIPRITTLLEDVIRTASLPNIPANGVVCIRKLDLGRISISTHSHFLSRRLDQLVRNLTFTRVTNALPEQDDAVAVWFSDGIEPYRLLSELLAKEQFPRAWYWSIAVPRWTQSMSTSESVLLCLSQLVQKSTGMTGITYALEPFVERGSIFRILDGIDAKQIEVIANELLLPSVPFLHPGIDTQSMRNTDEVTAAVSAFWLPMGWDEFVRQSLLRWAPNDIRLRLTLSMTLQKVGLPPHTKNVMKILQEILRQDIQNGRNKSNTTPTPTTQPKVKNTAKNDSKYLSSQVQTLHEGLSQETPVQESSSIELSSKELTSLDQSSKELNSEKLCSQETIEARTIDDSNIGDFRVVGDDDECTTKEYGDAPQFKMGCTPDQLSIQETKSQQQERQPPNPEQWPLVGQYSGVTSEYGGFLFLVPVLQLLGIVAQSETRFDEERLQLAQRVLWRIAHWLRIPANDPVLQFLVQPLSDPPNSLPFIAPRQWQVLLKNGSGSTLQVVHIQDQPGKRIIKEPVSRLILGVWQHDNSEQMHHWIDRYALQLQSDSSQAWSIDVLVNNIVIAMSRYVRHYAQMSIRTLVKRQAYIACTPTHIDWSASLSTLDNRVRMAGLDIDPGWLPSLQRVFYFHYIDEEA